MSIIEKTATTAESIPDHWIEITREIIRRDGVAARAGKQNTIELKSLRTNQWQPLMLHGSGTKFTSAEDRDLVLTKLISK